MLTTTVSSTKLDLLRNTLYLICALQIVLFMFFSFNKVRNFGKINFSQESTNQNTPIKTWIFTDSYFVPAKFREHANFLVLKRSLVLYGLREVNLKLAGTHCATWWANPLSVYEIKEHRMSQGVTKYQLTFGVQPGNIPFQMEVILTKNRPNETHPYVSNDLHYISATRLDLDQVRTNCSGADSNLDKICLCPEEKVKATKISEVARSLWNESDPEHPQWPPHVSAMVPDFLTFGKLDGYLKFPRNISGTVCDPEVKLLIYVSSKPSHVEQRRAIRDTYGNATYLDHYGVRLLFIFGRFEDASTQVQVDSEYEEYGDILQSDFSDHYQNQSLSELFFYNWLVTSCDLEKRPMPRWILKADDDFFLNVPLALRIAEENPNAEIIGHHMCPELAKRSGKYYVPKYMFAPTYWFGFVIGSAVLMRTDILAPLLRASLTSPLINMNDAYVTGILARAIGVDAQDSVYFGKRVIPGMEKCSWIKSTIFAYVSIPKKMTRHWRIFQKSSQKSKEVNCTLDEKQLVVPEVTTFKKMKCFYNY